MARIVGGVQSVVTFANFTTFTSRVIGVPVSGTPVQLPSIIIPEGASLFIRARVENGNRRICGKNAQRMGVFCAVRPKPQRNFRKQ